LIKEYLNSNTNKITFNCQKFRLSFYPLLIMTLLTEILGQVIVKQKFKRQYMSRPLKNSWAGKCVHAISIPNG